MSNLKRQRCGRCHKDLTPVAFSPSKRGKPGKWCRACRKAYRAEKVGAKKSAGRKVKVSRGDVVKHPSRKPAPKVGKVLKAALAEVPALS